MSELLRAEQIVAAVKALLVSAVASVNQRVYRDRTRAIGASIALPIINVVQGNDTPLGGNGPTNFSFIDSELEVFTDIATSTRNTEDIDTALNAIRREVHIALMGSTTLGLSFVHRIIPDGAEGPLRIAEAETVVFEMRVRWRVQYRSSITDASA